jgi:hypothetical protein
MGRVKRKTKKRRKKRERDNLEECKDVMKN